MNSFKTIFFSLLFTLFFFSIQVNAQSIQKITPSNAAHSAAEIKNTFGDLISVSNVKIEDFYNDHWNSSQPYDAAVNSPNAKLIDIQDSSVQFEWAIQGTPPVNGVKIGVLQLSDGSIQTFNTMDNSITLDLQPSLFLVVFQSDFGTIKSELDIIIIEKIIFSTGCNCDCNTFEEIYSGDFHPGSEIPSHIWGPNSSFNQYLYEISYVEPEGLTASFKAEIVFDINNFPISVEVDENSMNNIYFNNDESFIYVQDGDMGEIYGPVTFAQNPDSPADYTPVISYNPIYNFGDQKGIIKISECTRDQARSKTETNKSNTTYKEINLSEISTSFASNKTIEYYLPKDQQASIYLLDNQGRFIKTIVNHTNLKSGTYRHHLDLSSYPNGTYICILKTTDKVVPLKLIKTK